MAKGNSNSAELERQLTEIRSRSGIELPDGGLYETTQRAHSLLGTFVSLPDGVNEEIYRHFPVAAIATLETNFRVVVTRLVDSGSPYFERGLQLAKDHLKTSAEHFALLHRKSVSVGEMIAYSLPFNSLASIEAPLSALFGADLKAMVSTAVSPVWARNDFSENTQVVANVPELWRGLAETFARRHILAHEAAVSYKVSCKDAETAVVVCSELCEALEAILWSTIWKDVPFNQVEMNDEAWEKSQRTRLRLTSSVKLGLAIARADGSRQRFITQHLAWKRYASSLLRWLDEPFSMGSIRPLLASRDRDMVWLHRCDELDKWIGRMRPENPPTP